MPKKLFFPENGIKCIFAYVLENMLTLDKVQNISTFTCKSSKSDSRAFCKLSKLFKLYT